MLCILELPAKLGYCARYISNLEKPKVSSFFPLVIKRKSNTALDMGNIREIDHDGKEIASLCVNVPNDLPRNDNVLTQKLMLEYAEERILSLANRRPLV